MSRADVSGFFASVIECAIQGGQQTVERGSFFEVIPGARLNGATRIIRMPGAGEHDDFRGGRQCQKLGEHFQSVAVGHADIEQDQIGCFVARIVERFLEGQRIAHVMPLSPDMTRQDVVHHLIVIHDENIGEQSGVGRNRHIGFPVREIGFTPEGLGAGAGFRELTGVGNSCRTRRTAKSISRQFFGQGMISSASGSG
jgi:hypothetical protein